VLSIGNGKRIAHAFGLGDHAVMMGPVARGELGQIWRLESSNGTFAVKEWFEDFPEEELLEGALFQEAAAGAGVSCPSVVRSGDGGVLSYLDGTTVAVYGWVDLLDRDPAIDPAAVGELVAVLHRVRFRGGQPTDPWYTDPVGADRWDELVSELRERGAPFAEQLAAYRQELVALEELVVPPTNLRTCHRDLWADNLRATPDGGLCLIDWDNAGLADPAGELALALFEYCRGDAARARSLAGAYQEAGGPGRIRAPGDFSMPIAQLSHIGERACGLWLDATDDEGRARAQSLADEFVGEALTRAVIGDLLDGIRASR
jgi:Ser/Thr protein kinase RdoA (MazF antagonist)